MAKLLQRIKKAYGEASQRTIACAGEARYSNWHEPDMKVLKKRLKESTEYCFVDMPDAPTDVLVLVNDHPG